MTWYIHARLSRDGEEGLAEGLLLLVAMLSRYGNRCHPLRPSARKAALEWLSSTKIQDTLSLWPEVERDDAALTAGAITLLAESVAGWPENEKPSFAGLCSALENRMARSGGMEVLIPQNSSVQETGRDAVLSPSPQLTAVKSGRDLLDQVKLLSRWLGEQPQGWLASHRLMKTVRWDTVDQIPPLDSSGRTRLVPPKAAFAWLQSRPGMDTPRQRWLVRLLMARVAEQYGRNDMALHLLGELTASAPQLTLGDWEPGLLFEVQARRLKLLRMKASRSESDKTRLMPEMDALLAGLIAVDPARAMVLCG